MHSAGASEQSSFCGTHTQVIIAKAFQDCGEYPPAMASEAGFFEKYAEFFEDGVWEDDDQATDVMALIVLDQVPIQVASVSLLSAT